MGRPRRPAADSERCCHRNDTGRSSPRAKTGSLTDCRGGAAGHRLRSSAIRRQSLGHRRRTRKRRQPSKGEQQCQKSSLEERFQNLHEFVTQARTNLNRNNWDYLIGGSETETTLARNRAALDAWGFRPRVLRDVSNVDSSTTFFGKKLRIPVLCSAVGGLEVFEPGGGATVAKATREFGNGMILELRRASRPGENRRSLGRRLQNLPTLRPRGCRLGR